MNSKECLRCGTVKPTTEFYRRSASPDGLSPYCKSCVKIMRAAGREKKSLAKVLEDARKADIRKDANLMRHYGITLREYEDMFDEQDGCCSICGRHANKFQRNLAVDHDHTSGKVRGLLCPDCNRGLGGFNDNVELMATALRYLQKHSAQ